MKDSKLPPGISGTSPGIKKYTAHECRAGTLDYLPMLRFVRMGQLRISSVWHVPRHCHQDCELILITKGRIEVQIDEQSALMGPGYFYFIQPGQQHEEKSRCADGNYFYLQCEFKDETGRPASLVPPDIPGLRQWLYDKDGGWRRFFELLQKEVIALKPGWKEMAETFILQHIWRLRRQYHSISAKHSAQTLISHQQTIIEHARKFIRANFQRAISLDELARYCCVSYYRMEHIFKQVTGISSRQYILGIRLQCAKQLLGNPLLSVKTIADRVGFANPAYFCQLFKRETGLTPLAYRARGSPRVKVPKVTLSLPWRRGRYQS